MTATVHHIRPVEPDPLAELHVERERLGGELARFVIVDERRNAAEAKIGEVDAALGALDRADREAVAREGEAKERQISGLKQFGPSSPIDDDGEPDLLGDVVPEPIAAVATSRHETR